VVLVQTELVGSGITVYLLTDGCAAVSATECAAQGTCMSARVIAIPSVRGELKTRHGRSRSGNRVDMVTC
jgi:hypothetical protein